MSMSHLDTYISSIDAHLVSIIVFVLRIALQN